MYVPAHFSMTADDAAALARSVGTGHLVSLGDGVLDSSFVPFLLEDVGGGWRVRLHLARANAQARQLADGDEVLLIVQGPDAYVSPGFYPSKREHGRVVPTWNYVVVHIRGRVRTSRDHDALLDVVRDLTDVHERDLAEPWAVSDAPDEFVAEQLRAIVGVEIEVTELTGKTKLSQNRLPDDRAAVRDAYAAGTPRERAVADLMDG